MSKSSLTQGPVNCLGYLVICLLRQSHPTPLHYSPWFNVTNSYLGLAASFHRHHNLLQVTHDVPHPAGLIDVITTQPNHHKVILVTKDRGESSVTEEDGCLGSRSSVDCHIYPLYLQGPWHLAMPQ